MGKDLQQERVPEAAIDNVSLLDTRPQTVQAGLDLGDHPFVDDALADEFLATCRVQAADQRVRIRAIAKNARRVREQDQLFGLKLSGYRVGGGIGIDVEPSAIRINSQGGNHWH